MAAPNVKRSKSGRSDVRPGSRRDGEAGSGVRDENLGASDFYGRRLSLTNVVSIDEVVLQAKW